MIHLRNKIAQMLMMGFSGCALEPSQPFAKTLREDGLGGVLLFDFDLASKAYGKNLVTIEQIKQLTQQLTTYAGLAKGGRDLPLFVALDYEGGAVDRLTKIPGCMQTMKACDQAQLSDDMLYLEAAKMANTLKNLGINLNFAPVVDLNLNLEQGIIGKLGRGFSADPELVIHAARQFIQAFSDVGIVCTYKHFPGHGSAAGDTHEGFVDVTASYQSCELKPYFSLLKEKVHPVMVMTAHVINRQLDPSGLPATLSYPILTELLREKIGFDGVIVSDDLQMQAISHHYAIDDALTLTINAGADMLIFANQLDNITAGEVIDRIERLVYKGNISSLRIDDAYQRILTLKKNQKMMSSNLANA